jgi:hypothetical protein
MRRFSNNRNRIAAVLMCAFVAFAGCSEQPTRPEYAGAGDEDAPQFTHKPGHGGKGGGKATTWTQYSGDITSNWFTSLRDDAVLHFPFEDTTGDCPGLTGWPDTKPDWGGYAGPAWTPDERKGQFRCTKCWVSGDTPDDPDGWINLTIQEWNDPPEETIIDNNTTVVLFKNHVALLGNGSHTPDGVEDDSERCVTYTATITTESPF